MPATRPYFVKFKGVVRMVEATNPAEAVRHVVGADIEELRPARASEVSAWMREGRPFDVAGAKPKPLVPRGKEDSGAEFTAADARAWVLDQLGIVPGAAVSDGFAAIIGAFDRAVEAGAMDEASFRVLESVPNFLDVIGAAVGDAFPASIKSIIAHGHIPMGLDVLVGYIADRKDHELWALDQPGGKPLAGENIERDEQIAE